jgi:hypothetical protein
MTAYFSFWMAVGLLSLILLAVLKFRQEFLSRNLRRKANKLIEVGEWQNAVALYNEAIVIQLDCERPLRKLSSELERIYYQNGTKLDIGRILRCPRLIAEITRSKVADQKKSELVGKLYQETAAYLGEIAQSTLGSNIGQG